MYILLTIFIILFSYHDSEGASQKSTVFCNTKVSKKSNSEISILLRILEDNFKSIKSRQLDSDGLVKALDNILSKTKYSRLLACKKPLDQKIITKEIKFVTSKNKGNDFAVTRGWAKDNFFKTNLIFDLRMHPFSSLFFYAHELFHWCREKHHLELMINKPLSLKYEYEDEDEVEEVIAKKMEIDLFNYISEIEPAICEAPGPVTTLSETYNFFQEQLNPLGDKILSVPWEAYLDDTALSTEDVNHFAEIINSYGSKKSRGKKKFPSPQPPSISNKSVQEVNR